MNKKITALIFIITFLIFSCSQPIYSALDKLTGSGNGIEFPDANLEAAIRAEIEKPTGDILKTDVESITALDLTDKSITNLTGLENLTGLTNLNLFGNTGISDINVISGLSALTELILFSLDLTDDDMVVVGTLTGLLNLFIGKMENLSASHDYLAQLNNMDILLLVDVSLNDIGLQNLSDMNNLRVFHYYMEDSSTASLTIPEDLSPLSGLSELVALQLVCNTGGTTDFSVLADLTLSSLKLENCQMDNTDLSDLLGGTGLTFLDSLSLGNVVTPHPMNGLNSNTISDLTGIDAKLNVVTDLSLKNLPTGITNWNLLNNAGSYTAGIDVTIDLSYCSMLSSNFMSFDNDYVTILDIGHNKLNMLTSTWLTETRCAAIKELYLNDKSQPLASTSDFFNLGDGSLDILDLTNCQIDTTFNTYDLSGFANIVNLILNNEGGTYNNTITSATFNQITPPSGSVSNLVMEDLGLTDLYWLCSWDGSFWIDNLSWGGTTIPSNIYVNGNTLNSNDLNSDGAPAEDFQTIINENTAGYDVITAEY